MSPDASSSELRDRSSSSLAPLQMRPISSRDNSKSVYQSGSSLPSIGADFQTGRMSRLDSMAVAPVAWVGTREPTGSGLATVGEDDDGQQESQSVAISIPETLNESYFPTPVTDEKTVTKWEVSVMLHACLEIVFSLPCLLFVLISMSFLFSVLLRQMFSCLSARLCHVQFSCFLFYCFFFYVRFDFLFSLVHGCVAQKKCACFIHVVSIELDVIDRSICIFIRVVTLGRRRDFCDDNAGHYSFGQFARLYN